MRHAILLEIACLRLMAGHAWAMKFQGTIGELVNRRKLGLILAAIGCAVVGFGLLANSRAASFVIGQEIESGTLAGQAKSVNQNTASGGQAVVFGTSPGGRPIAYGSDGRGNPRTDDCTDVVEVTEDLQQAVNAMRAGGTVCVAASDRSAVALQISKAMVVRANGPTKIRSAVISGSSVTLDGFTVVGGSSNGVAFSGENHRITNNLVTGRGITTGIACTGSCGSQHYIAGNTVTAVQNYGIILNNGSAITVEKNNVYDLWRSSATSDVDAMRLWGTGHVIRHNYFHDINEFKSARSGGDTPHTDCWQSFQTGDNKQLRQVLIENNYCVRVSRQCMILSNHLTGSYDIRDVTFRGNVCETYDSSVVNLGSVAAITLENNLFLGGVRAQVLTVDYTREENPVGLPDKDIRLRNNIVVKGLASTSYFYRNSTRTLIDNTDNLLVQNGLVKTNADAFQGAANVSYAAVKATDFTFYRQLAQQYEVVDAGSPPLTANFTSDIDAGPRIRGASIDIGPFEIR